VVLKRLEDGCIFILTVVGADGRQALVFDYLAMQVEQVAASGINSGRKLIPGYL
jgi:hypothetical protein